MTLDSWGPGDGLLERLRPVPIVRGRPETLELDPVGSLVGHASPPHAPGRSRHPAEHREAD